MSHSRKGAQGHLVCGGPLAGGGVGPFSSVGLNGGLPRNVIEAPGFQAGQAPKNIVGPPLTSWIRRTPSLMHSALAVFWINWMVSMLQTPRPYARAKP